MQADELTALRDAWIDRRITRHDTVSPRLIAEFNRLFEIQYDRVRDFLILHYRVNQRHGEALWDHVRTMQIPDSLAHKISLFESRAWAPEYEQGLFSRDSWLSVLFGQNLTPRAYDRLADGLGLEELETRMRDLKARIDANVGAMSSHAAFVAGDCPGTAAVPALAVAG